MSTSKPTIVEIKDFVISLSPDTALGLNGLSGRFYPCWDIISTNLFNIACSFFVDTLIPRSITHLCLMLIYKVTNPLRFSELTPISLSNFNCKIISKLLNTKFSSVIHKTISIQQDSFMKDRSIRNNIMLT